MKLKPILPSLREKKRYIAFEILAEDMLELKSVENAIVGTSQGFLGELTMAKTGMRMLPDTFNDNKGLIRVGSPYVDHVKAALGLVDKIDQKPVSVRSLGVSGILNKAVTNYLKG